VTQRRRRPRADTPPPPPPTVPDLTRAPELAAIILLEHALEVASAALLAEHQTLIDDYHLIRDQGAVVVLAHLICRREAALRETLRRYRRAVRDTVTPLPKEAPDDPLF